ncbi:TonB-dependent receptor plug domain-containing protein [Chitinimonas lacunae]|uniref:TonB-dependent receptor plug domain-containing protein n=1 Tax=Chitinimonas lacunae TaxID=1963018 RepID=A0ABV8MSN2_9NEIS
MPTARALRYISLCFTCLAVVGAETELTVFDLNLEALRDLKVLTASKRPQRVGEAPAVISVVTADDIRHFGYRSVAEALSQVPGLYDVYDQVAHNVGVRGIHPGVRAYSRLLKVMIDSQPIAFRADASNYLGPELLDPALIERIEVVRGPASALYGADAFLGVVNIITRRPESSSLQATVRGFAGGEQGFGVSLHGEGRHGNWSWLAGLSLDDTDRSGQPLPPSSPFYSRLGGANVRSADDQSRPRNLLLRVDHRSDRHDSGVLLHVYRLDNHGQFLDFGVLSPRNRVALRQETLRLRHERREWHGWTLRGAAALSHGGPDNRERLDLGSTASHPRRDFGFSALDLQFEAERTLGETQVLTMGIDRSVDHEERMRVYSVRSNNGQSSLISGEDGEVRLRNLGLYLQYSLRPWPEWGLTVNLRKDRHNVYGDTVNHRVAMVGEVGNIAYKLLHGSSYKAPAALQLYAQPLFAGEVLGNPALEPEHARITEAALSGRISSQLWWSANAYVMTVDDKVELLPRGVNQRPQNSGKQKGRGLETELAWAPGAHRFDLRLAWQRSVDIAQPILQASQEAPTASYPRLTVGLAWRYFDQKWGSFALSGRHVSPRRASKVNSQENLLRPYQLPSYSVFDANWRHEKGPHSLSLRLANLTDRRYAEPGYGGIDLPAPRRSAMLSYGYRFY